MLIDVDFINTLLNFAYENQDKLSDEDFNNLTKTSNVLKADDILTNTIEDVSSLNKEVNTNESVNVTIDKNTLNELINTIKDTKDEIANLKNEISALQQSSALGNIQVLKNAKVKAKLENSNINIHNTIEKLDKSIDKRNNLSFELKTIAHHTKNLVNVMRGKEVSRQKVEPSQKFVKNLVARKEKLVDKEIVNNQKIEELSKPSILGKIAKNKKIINGEKEPTKDEPIQEKEPSFDDKCNNLATDITLFLQNTSHSVGTIGEIKECLIFGDNDSIKQGLFYATNDSDNYLIKAIEKFELENYPKELLLSVNEELMLIQKNDNQVNFKIYDNDLNLLSDNTLDSNQNIYKDFNEFSQSDFKDLVLNDKCKVGDVAKFKKAISKAIEKPKVEQQKTKPKTRENVML